MGSGWRRRRVGFSRFSAWNVFQRRAPVVSTDHGWWHPEGKPEELYDVMELNVNKLMPWGCGKSGIGANYKCLLCRIEKMTEEELAAAKAKELLRKNLGNGR